jgi:hypothetical protein
MVEAIVVERKLRRLQPWLPASRTGFAGVNGFIALFQTMRDCGHGRPSRRVTSLQANREVCACSARSYEICEAWTCVAKILLQRNFNLVPARSAD